ncbi:MAG: hypothetical protein LIR50_13430 [Bacillota bacterium]|nr:hypothetical protein [Bacillota bacterium]
MIRISRQTRYSDSLRNYKIYIDDIYCGDIKDGEIKELDIENGEHSIYLKIDWCRSKKLNFIVNSNELLEFYCGNSMNGLKWLLVFVYITFKKNCYLFIQPNKCEMVLNDKNNYIGTLFLGISLAIFPTFYILYGIFNHLNFEYIASNISILGWLLIFYSIFKIIKSKNIKKDI